MQYKVPQNVQREDTIIGPITLRQLAILGFGGGIAYAIYVSLARTYFIEIWLPPVAIISALTLAFAFLKINNLEFHVYLMRQLEYRLLPKKRIWIQHTATPFIPPFQAKEKKDDNNKKAEKQVKKESINDLTNILDSYGKHQELNKMVKQNYKK